MDKVDLGELAGVRQAIDWTVKNCPNAPYAPVKREVLESLEAKLEKAREALEKAGYLLAEAHGYTKANGDAGDLEQRLQHAFQVIGQMLDAEELSHD